MSIFYTSDILTSNFLSEEESYHCCKVLRLQKNNEIKIVDGNGTLCLAKIVEPSTKNTKVEIIKVFEDFEKRPYRLHLAFAPTKNIDRTEWLIEKSVEIGVDTITPLLCQFSERKIVKQERLEKIVVAASKQSIKAYFAKVNTLSNFNNFVENTAEDQRFIAHCHDLEKQPLFYCCKKGGDTVILIGPEGDFSKKEVLYAQNNGFSSVSLGKSRLRTETAGIIAVNTISIINGVG